LGVYYAVAESCFVLKKEVIYTSIPLSEWLQRQKEEALSPNNLWYAGEWLGHSPSNEEAFRHYIRHGGAADFEKRQQETTKQN
jgi:hypothetical protein